MLAGISQISFVPETMPTPCQVPEPLALPDRGCDNQPEAEEPSPSKDDDPAPPHDAQMLHQRAENSKEEEKDADQAQRRSQVAKAAGLKLPHRSSQQAQQVEKVTRM